MASPLAGINVLDASGFVSGPLAGTILADLGATVIKVEPPSGDALLRWGPQIQGRSAVYSNCNRGKDVVSLDLKTDDGRLHFLELAQQADVLITNWRTGVVDRLGLTDALAERTALVWIRITGWGSDGPLADRPAFDGSVQARSGIAWCQGDAEPELIRMFIADKITATIAAQAVTAALFERTRTGLGTTIDLPMLDSLSYFNFPDLMQNRTVIADAPIDARNLQIEANRPVRTADGWIVISPVGGRQLKATLQAIGRSDAVMHMRDAPTAHELTLRLMALCDAACPQRTTAEWMVVFDGLDVPIAPVLDLDQHLADPQVVHNRIYGTVRDSFRGDTRRARYPARFGDDPVRGATAPARNVDIAAWPTRPAAARSTEGT